jgi:hypothetical protein
LPITATPAATLATSIQQRLVRAVTESDLVGFGLLAELAAAQLGADDAVAVLTALPAAVPSLAVARCLEFLHGDSWTSVARAIVLAACTELAAVGAEPGFDFSYQALENGRPVLLMSRDLFAAINESRPASLHLVRCFLGVPEE